MQYKGFLFNTQIKCQKKRKFFKKTKCTQKAGDNLKEVDAHYYLPNRNEDLIHQELEGDIIDKYREYFYKDIVCICK